MSRPFYIIAHEINTLKKINRAFRQGANGIECDLWQDEDERWWVSHDGDTKTDLVQWLQHIGKAEKRFNSKLAVIIFDIKKDQPIEALRDVINANLPTALPHVYSVARLDMAHIFTPIARHLYTYEAIAIDEEEEPKEVARFFQSLGTRKCWYAFGVTAFLPYNTKYHESMQQARPFRSAGIFARIYTWTVVHKTAIKKYIEEDEVDAILVNLRRFFMRPIKVTRRLVRKNPSLHLATRQTPLC